MTLKLFKRAGKRNRVSRRICICRMCSANKYAQKSSGVAGFGFVRARYLGTEARTECTAVVLPGTVQAFVPLDMLDEFKTKIENVLGENMCHVLSIRPVGGYELK